MKRADVLNESQLQEVIFLLDESQYRILFEEKEIEFFLYQSPGR